MIGFYVLGGGWGHLTRTKTFITNSSINSPFKIITTNKDASRFFNRGNIAYINPEYANSPGNLKNAIKKIAVENDFNKFYIDTFPNGILGELDPILFGEINIYYLARRLKWNNYSACIKQPLHFKKTYLFEPLEPAHHKFVTINSEQSELTKLCFPTPETIEVKAKVAALESPLWLIVHSCNTEEVQLLIDHAIDIASIEKIDPQLLVLSEADIPTTLNVLLLKNENPLNWYPFADRIFSGAGFNTMHQLSNFKDIHVCLPFQRRFDDQFWRSRQPNLL